MTPPTLDELKEQHIIHDLDIPVVIHNFNNLIGRILQRETDSWLSRLQPNHVLEVGAHCGQITRVLRDRDVKVTPIDIDSEAISLAQVLTGIEVEETSFYDRAPGTDETWDLGLFRDVVSHLKTEDMIRRLCELKIPRVLIIDSNLSNPLLGLSRRWIGHVEHDEEPLETYIEAFIRAGYRAAFVEYAEYLAWPLSGGLLVRQILPRNPWLEKAVMLLDKLMGKILLTDHLRKRFAWRYRVCFERVDNRAS